MPGRERSISEPLRTARLLSKHPARTALVLVLGLLAMLWVIQLVNASLHYQLNLDGTRRMAWQGPHLLEIWPDLIPHMAAVSLSVRWLHLIFALLHRST